MVKKADFFERVGKSLQERADWLRVGVSAWRTASRDSSTVVIGDQCISLRFPDGEREPQLAEWVQIYGLDDYGLRQLPATPSRILDIGGNCGLFSLAARARFPHATIHCYEPNPELHGIIDHNLKGLDITLFPEAVGDGAGPVDLENRGPSGAGMAVPSSAGTIPSISLNHALERLEGNIDLAKIDCEGSEWLMLAKDDGWDSIQHLSLEYHLTAGAGHTLGELVQRLGELDFHLRRIEERQTRFNGLVWADRGTQGEFARSDNAIE